MPRHDSDEPRASGDATAGDAGVGICLGCRWVRVQPTTRGARFYRCARADRDARYLRYPPLPVRHCDGFESRAR